ncbi:L,D-transpeptidase [Lactobacillus selangorensis]|uniref:L,D-transpeptidase n=1 Tax=Lactobacillus selangorensis TaxID=81857 RepID=UPI003B84AEB6
MLLCGLLCVGALLQPLTQTVQATSTKKTINWRKPSQQKAYPNLKKHPQVWIDVSQKKQRVYIKDGKKVLYTMYASTGKDHSTPNGTFHIQKERGKFFYNQQSGEGAKYWTSWKDHGVYLFHSVPTDQEGHFLKKEADQLGKEANSHGCVRLTVPDAKWINENMPVGTKVVIHQ